MDNVADPDITFDGDGVCNYFHEYRKAEQESVFSGQEGEERLSVLTNKIKASGRNKPYDCLIGLSGGVDSTYVAYLVKKMGLRPLAVHLDNGWDSELAARNIENVITKLNIDLYTVVINWEEFKDIQIAYLKASVVDIEVVSDHAIFATMYKVAKQKRIPYIISGTNIVTEYVMPPSWLYSKMDANNLRDIHKKYGRLKLKTYPVFDFKMFLYYSAVLRLHPVSILNYVPYIKDDVKELIKRELDWRDYGGKHYESIFTKFYQAYILPEKFGIDKRKAHLSTLICSGQVTKDQALCELTKPLYNSEELESDKEYVLKKLGLEKEEFSAIMKTKVQLHQHFKSDKKFKDAYMQLLIKTKDMRHILKRGK